MTTRARRLNHDQDPGDRDPHALRRAFDVSVASSRHTDGRDSALVEAGRSIADRIDSAITVGDGVEVTKALYLIPHMLNVLREMYATPASRIAAEEAAAPAPEPRPAENRLARMRALQAGNPRTG